MAKVLFLHRLLYLFAVLATGAQGQDVSWTHYAADAASTKFTPLAQIDQDNFAELIVAWRYAPPDGQVSRSFDANRGTPLVVDGVLYYASPLAILCAVDASTGQELWTFDPKSWRMANGFVGNLRGIAHWSDGENGRIFFGTASDRLYSIDLKTGAPDPAFGAGGYVDVAGALRRSIDRDRYGITSPPIVCRGVVAVGSAIVDWRFRTPDEYTAPGDVQAFDARTGAKVWEFRTIPQQGDFGNETWHSDAWKTAGAANVWAAMSADEALGYIYLPVSTPSHDFYGGERPGDNLFGESLVCVRAETGERVWHYQLIHHGLWDYDIPAAPVLMDVQIDGRARKIVAQVSKQAFCYVFDRITGEPIWPIVERSVPQSSVAGEKTSLTQPIPSKPAAFDRQGLSEENLIDFTPELRQQAQEMVAKFRYGPLYTPPSEEGTILVPGLLGGADWSGAAAHPGKGLLYVPSHTLPALVWVGRSDNPSAYSDYSAGTSEPFIGPQGLPITKPPYGRITAIDIQTGEHVWMSAVGRGPVDHPALAHLDLPDLGWANRSFAVATSTLLLVASQDPQSLSNQRRGSRSAVGSQPAYLRAYDLDTGALIGQVALPGYASGSLMSYMVAGRQYVAVPVGSRRSGPELLVLALPR